MFDLLNAIKSEPWLITPESMETMLSIAARTNDIAAVRAEMGEKLRNTRTTEIRNGVAVIPVTGPIFRYANLFTEMSGATSTQVLALDINQALKNRSVKSILLDIDSPGGQATGLFELSDMIRDGGAKKPVNAYIGGTGASAAYLIAAAAGAGNIYASRSAAVGSIGAVLTVRDDSEAKTKLGIREHTFVSTVSPNKNADPSTEDGQKQIQSLVDTIGRLFVETVATYRGVTAQHVLDNYGKGGMFIGAYAQKAGLVDSLFTFEALIASMQGASAPKGRLSLAQKNLEIMKMEE